MSSKKKLFSFDLDGTLLNSESKLSEENIAALEAARNKGHVLVAATGRNYIYSQLVLKEHWGLFDYYVGCNGAIVHHIHDRKLVSSENKISYDFVDQIIDEIKDVGGTIQISTEWNVFTDIHIDEANKVLKPIVKERLFDPFPSIDQMEEKDKNSIILISVHFEEHNVRKIWRRWVEKFGNDYEFTITSKNNIDINIKNISKLASIKEIVKHENIEYENVFVFGDSQNDVKALDYYTNTYAMGNGFQDAKDVAKHVIGDNNSNDIAKIIKKNI